MTTEEKKKNRGEAFVEFILNRMKNDNGFRAGLKRADNPATEYQSWEFLAAFGVNIEKEWERRPFAVIGAAVAKAKIEVDGFLGIGKAIAQCYEDGNASDQAKAKLRRVLACSNVEEVCHILRPLLSLINSHGVHLNYGQLLQDLLWFNVNEHTKAKWAQDFYGKREEE